MEDFNLIEAAVSRVDVRQVSGCDAVFASSCAQSVAPLSLLWQAQCLWPEDRDRILGEQEARERAGPLMKEAMDGMRKTLGGRHQHTLTVITGMCDLLKQRGELAKSRCCSWRSSWCRGRHWALAIQIRWIQ